MIESHTATRYVVPLREGGSLPAIVETESGGSYVVKFRGAGQGARALIAELIVGGIARRIGLPVPELVLIDLPGSFGRSEGDPEIQDILEGSRGTNVGMRFLEGAFNYDPVAVNEVDPGFAARVVWFDAFVSNIDRTPRNPNILYWNDELWLIDHGAALYFHHSWDSLDETRMRAPFAGIGDHVLLEFAGDIMGVDEPMAALVTDELLAETLEDVPDDLLMDAPRGTTPPFATPEENRSAYCRYFQARLERPRAFAITAEEARGKVAEDRSKQLGYRR